MGEKKKNPQDTQTIDYRHCVKIKKSLARMNRNILNNKVSYTRTKT